MCVGRPTGLRTCFKLKGQHKCTTQADSLERKNCYSCLFINPEQQKCSKGHDAGPACSCASLPSAAWMLAAADKQGGLCCSGKQLHFDSRTQPIYLYPSGKEGLQDRETSTQLTMLCQKSAHLQSMHPCVESQQMPTPQGKSEVVFCRGLGMMTKQSVGLPSEIFAHAQDHSTETSTSSSFIMWASVEILLALSITAP